ncbi:hypothetical protein BKA93DRAFT_746442 [Sparassis latifolia]
MKKLRGLPSGAGLDTQAPVQLDHEVSSVDGDAVGKPAVAVGGSTHMAAPLAGGCALEELLQAGLSELEYAEDPSMDEQHAGWDARVMGVVSDEDISAHNFPLTEATGLLKVILHDIKTYVKPAVLHRSEIIKLLREHETQCYPR